MGICFCLTDHRMRNFGLLVTSSSSMCIRVVIKLVSQLRRMEQWTQSFLWNGWTWQKGIRIFNFSFFNALGLCESSFQNLF
jgi:hypothetical protein